MDRERERYVTDAEFGAIYDAAPLIVQAVMGLCYFTGQRIGDVLGILVIGLFASCAHSCAADCP